MFNPEKKYTDRELMALAVQLATKSVPEDDGRSHPLVGAVIARDGYVLQTGFRGQAEGAHAEETALAHLTWEQAYGATVYTTLEPCTARGVTACTQRLITKRVNKVYIGMLDPNPDIRGRGEWLLEDVGIAIGKFDPDLVKQVRAQNSDFISYMQGIGITISSPGTGMHVYSPVFVTGTYRVRPRPGDHIVVFGRSDHTYYPQAPISWRDDLDQRTWKCGPVYLGGPEAPSKPSEFGIVVARVSEDFDVWLRSYSRVAKLTEQWIGAEMPSLPRGFEVLASVNIIRI